MPKARCDEEEGASSKRRRTEEQQPPPPPKQQHRYLILDDWSLGYSIRKIDLFHNDLLLLPNGLARDVAAIRLPPPIFRLKLPREQPLFFTTALGSSIVATHPEEDDDGLAGRRGNPNCGGAIFDVHKGSLDFIPRPTGREFSPVYFSIGNKLLALGSHSLQLLDLPPSMDDPSSDLDSLSWRELPDAPFHSAEVVSHAVLPGKQATTIFVSVGLITDHATYSFQIMADDGAAGSPTWKRVGDWALPFYGRGYFDPALNAWVGLSMYSLETGHICACELVSPTGGSDYGHRPAWKFSKEKLFSDDPSETHVGATLVYMGNNSGRSRSRFCLVECVVVYYKYRYRPTRAPYHVEDKDGYRPEAFRYFYRATTFSLEYDENGELTTGGSRRVRYYKAPKGDVSRFMCEVPVAFWL